MSRIDLASKNLLANSCRSFSKSDLKETAIRNVENFAEKRDEVLPLSSILLTIVRVQFSLSRKSTESISNSKDFFQSRLAPSTKKTTSTFPNSNTIWDQGPSWSHKMVFEGDRRVRLWRHF